MSLARLSLPISLVLCLGAQEGIDLPTVQHGVEDEAVPDQFRPVLDIRYDGKFLVEGELLYDPEVHGVRDDPFLDLRKWLAKTATRMRKDHIDQEGQTGPMIPDEPILIRPDRSAPFRYVQKTMEFCGEQGTQIWKIQLACRTPDAGAGRLAAYLPKDVGVNHFDAEPVERVEVLIRVLAPGTQFEPGAPGEPRKVATVDSGRFVYGEDRALQFSVGPFKTTDREALLARLVKLRRLRKEADEGPIPVTIDARPGTIYQDVTEVLDMVLTAGFVEITFVGAYEEK